MTDQKELHCPNCGAPTGPGIEDERLIYPCYSCGAEYEMGTLGKPLTASQWMAVIRRLVGDLRSAQNNVSYKTTKLKEGILMAQEMIESEESECTNSSEYVCSQCGPDSNGGDIHALTHHHIPPRTVAEAKAELRTEDEEG